MVMDEGEDGNGEEAEAMMRAEPKYYESRELEYTNGDAYRGECVDETRHGRGRHVCSTGDVYDGGWKDDKRHGVGTMTFAVEGEGDVGGDGESGGDGDGAARESAEAVRATLPGERDDMSDMDGRWSTEADLLAEAAHGAPPVHDGDAGWRRRPWRGRRRRSPRRHRRG